MSGRGTVTLAVLAAVSLPAEAVACANAMAGAKSGLDYAVPVLAAVAIALGIARRRQIYLPWPSQLLIACCALVALSLIAGVFGFAFVPRFWEVVLSLFVLPLALLAARIVGGPLPGPPV